MVEREHSKQLHLVPVRHANGRVDASRAARICRAKVCKCTECGEMKQRCLNVVSCGTNATPCRAPSYAKGFQMVNPATLQFQLQRSGTLGSHSAHMIDSGPVKRVLVQPRQAELSLVRLGVGLQRCTQASQPSRTMQRGQEVAASTVPAEAALHLRCLSITLPERIVATSMLHQCKHTGAEL